MISKIIQRVSIQHKSLTYLSTRQMSDEMLGDGAFHRSSLYGTIPEMTYGGALSFLRRKYTKNIFGHGDKGDEKADVVVSGIPYDGAVTYRSGARLGPRAIRNASVQLSELKPYPWGFDPFETLAVIDYGDAMLDPHHPHTIRQSIKDHAAKILNAKAPAGFTGSDHSPPKMLTFGGDHFVTYPLLQAHAERFGAPLSLIHFDAHCDTWDISGEDELNHGTMFRQAANEGIVDPSKSVQIGIRTWNDDFMGYNILGADWVHANGTDAVLKRIAEIVPSDRPVYVTFDIDCLDPAFAPGTGTPVPGGLSSAQALHIIRSLASLNLNIVGADVVEVSPAYDISEVTALSAAHIATDLLCMWAVKKKEGKF